MTRIALSCVKWVSKAVALCLGLAAMLALVVVLAALTAVMILAVADPAPTVLVAEGRNGR
jgi:hypothetical protein